MNRDWEFCCDRFWWLGVCYAMSTLNYLSWCWNKTSGWYCIRCLKREPLHSTCWTQVWFQQVATKVSLAIQNCWNSLTQTLSRGWWPLTLTFTKLPGTFHPSCSRGHRWHPSPCGVFMPIKYYSTHFDLYLGYIWKICFSDFARQWKDHEQVTGSSTSRHFSTCAMPWMNAQLRC